MRTTFDPENLRFEARKNKILKRLLPAMSTLDDRCKTIPIDQLLATPTLSLTRSELVQGLKRAQEHSIGRFIAGRRGKPSRFSLSVKPGELRDVLNGTFAAPTRAATLPQKANGLTSHTFRLRHNLQITVELPEDLQKTEASRLAKFILSLPFDGVAE